MLIVSLLYTISTYERFHIHVLLSDSRGDKDIGIGVYMHSYWEKEYVFFFTCSLANFNITNLSIGLVEKWEL